MKAFILKTLMFMLAVLCTAEIMAQVPQGFNFQAVARNAEGELIKDATLAVKISIIKGKEDGSSVYSETQNPATNEVGMFHLVIGEGTSEDDFGAIDWSSDNYYVKLEIDPAGGTEYEALGTTRLLSVPYALVAHKAITGGSGSPGSGVTEFTFNKADGDTSFIINSVGTESLPPIVSTSSTEGQNSGGEFYAKSGAGNENLQAGVYGDAQGEGTGSHIGVFGSVINPDATTGDRFGLYGQASSKSKYTYGVRGYSLGVGNGDEGENYGEGSINFGVHGIASGNTWNNSGLEAEAFGTAGKHNFGISGLSHAGTGEAVKNHGVAGRAWGPGINFGVYGVAWDGVENYAGYFDGNTVVNGNLNVDGEITHSGSITQTSDRSLKEEVEELENALATVMKLNPTTYKFKGNGEYNGLYLSEGQHFGLIAQEVETVLPSLVRNNTHTYNENGATKSMDYKSMNYIELIPFLIKAVQEQQQEIEQLKKELSELKN